MQQLLEDRTILDLVELIYAAGTDPAQWSMFVSRMHDLIPESAFSLHLSIEGTELASRSTAAGFAPEHIQSYFAHYQHINPYNDIFAKIPVGQVHTLSGLVPPGFIDKHEFFHDWLKPAGGFTHAAGLVVARDAQRLLRLTFDLPQRQSELENPAAALLARISPHLARAFRVNELLGAAAATDQVLAGTLSCLDGCAMIVSKTRAVAMNTQAEALVRTGKFFKVHRDRLKFIALEHDRAYVAGLAMALDSARSAAPAMFRLEDADGTSIVVTILPLRLSTLSFAHADAGIGALVVMQTGAGTVLPRDMLRKMFRLTEAETDVALKIAAGLSVEEIATGAGVSKVTVRNQLAAVMTKMGVNRQAGIVATVASLTPKLRLSRP